MKNPVAKNFNKFNRAATHVDRKKESKRNPALEGIYQCYQCDKYTDWLAPDSRCGDCTRYTPEEIMGE